MDSLKEGRAYRRRVSPGGLVSFNVRRAQTDLFISASADVRAAAGVLTSKYRALVEEYALENKSFQESLRPVRAPGHAAPIIRDMCESAAACGVGPMASVAGAIAEYVGRGLLFQSDEVIVENGGDIFMKTRCRRVAGIYAGESVFNGRIGIEIFPENTPCGICASSGTVGHSLNFGSADAVVVLSRSASLSDAAATACSNMAKDGDCIEKVIEFACSIGGVKGIVVVVGDRMGAWGEVQIKELGA